MTRSVYSETYYELGSPGVGSFAGPTPADGTVFVVRDMIFTSPTTTLSDAPPALEGFQVVKWEPGVPIWGLQYPYVQLNRPYHWEGRTVLGPDQYLLITINDDNWSFTIMGYSLTLP